MRGKEVTCRMEELAGLLPCLVDEEKTPEPDDLPTLARAMPVLTFDEVHQPFLLNLRGGARSEP
jgi:hypothetical protein